MMKGCDMRILAIALLITLSSATVIPKEEDTINEVEHVEENTTITPEPYDFVVKLAYNLKEEKVPEYIIDVIFEKPSERNITSEEIINLFTPQKFTIEKTIEVLGLFSTTSQKFFTLENLQHSLNTLNLPFRTFYNTLRTKLALEGKPLRDALISLGIDSARFSEGLAYGDPDPYEEFKKGTFTKESLENATKLAGISLEALYSTARDIFIEAIGKLPVDNFLDNLKQHSVDKNIAFQIWNNLQNTLQDVYNVPVFRDLLNQIDVKLKQNLTLGVITGANNITINRKTYNIWRLEQKIVSILAETFTTHIFLNVEEIVENEYSNLVVLKFSPVGPEENELLSSRIIAVGQGELHNCRYITVQKGTVILENIDRAIQQQESIEIAKGNVEELILGSPLVCENKVYGLARDIKDDVIILDTYSTASVNRLSFIMLCVSLVAYVSYM